MKSEKYGGFWVLLFVILTGVWVGLLYGYNRYKSVKDIVETEVEPTASRVASLLEEAPAEQRALLGALLANGAPQPTVQATTVDNTNDPGEVLHNPISRMIAEEITYIDQSEATMRVYNSHTSARKPEFVNPDSAYNQAQHEKMLELGRNTSGPPR